MSADFITDASETITSADGGREVVFRWRQSADLGSGNFRFRWDLTDAATGETIDWETGITPDPAKAFESAHGLVGGSSAYGNFLLPQDDR